MRNNKFTTKEEYLQYRKEWKAEYKQLSEDIRETKKEILDLQKHKEYAGALQYHKLCQRKLASDMIKELKLAKAESNRLYWESKAVPA